MEHAEKATHRATREHNERLVVGTIYDDGPISRADVARATGLTRTTVSEVVAGLLDVGLVREVGRGPSTGGKAPILLEMPDRARIIVALDLGESEFRGALVDLRGEVVRTVEVPVEGRNGERALALVLDLADQLLAGAEGTVLGIGIGTPGLIDSAEGTVLQAVNLDWRDLPLGRLLRERHGLPVHVANDSQACALAEHVFGEVRGRNLVAIKVGQGIGAGLVLNGELYQGDGHGAGEIGHTTVDRDGERCRCGSRGCLETVASTRAVLWRIAAASRAAAPGTLEEAVAAFCAGEEPARSVVLEAGERLGWAIAALVGALNVHRIVVTGTMATFGEDWLAAARDGMARSAFPALVRDTTLEIGRIDDIVLRGASALLLTRELGLSLRPIVRSAKARGVA